MSGPSRGFGPDWGIDDAPACDYCGEEPQASDYGACLTCKESHDENETGPDIYDGNGRLIPRGPEYDFYLAQM